MAGTGVIRRIGIGAAEAALGTLPAPGANINWGGEGWSDFTVIGDRNQGDLADLDEDAMNLSPFNESLVINPPLSQAPEDEIVFKNGMETFGFACYSIGLEALRLSSTTVVADNVVTEGLTLTKKSIAVEITGIAVHYFPATRIRITGFPAAIKTLAKLTFEATVFGTGEYPAGWAIHYFNG